MNLRTYNSVHAAVLHAIFDFDRIEAKPRRLWSATVAPDGPSVPAPASFVGFVALASITMSRPSDKRLSFR
jgi:hypothetical protein